MKKKGFLIIEHNKYVTDPRCIVIADSLERAAKICGGYHEKDKDGNELARVPRNKFVFSKGTKNKLSSLVFRKGSIQISLDPRERKDGFFLLQELPVMS